ncbi:MAG: hypothetical protein GTO54_08780 [Nitrososphaeria archaeon]|nr:hypothetical protein [Nitrososphaeria archaeon]
MDKPKDSRFPHETIPAIEGHHPRCENFSTHVFQIGGRTFCTGCTGLLLGGLAVLSGTILYFFGDLYVEHIILVVLVGVSGVALGLLQFSLFNTQRISIRLFLNAYFVVGIFLLLVGIDEIAQSLIADLLFAALSIFWLLTRISLSKWNHERICYSCNIDMCKYQIKTTF